MVDNLFEKRLRPASKEGLGEDASRERSRGCKISYIHNIASIQTTVGVPLGEFYVGEHIEATTTREASVENTLIELTFVYQRHMRVIPDAAVTRKDYFA